jgi:hypothetical protein
MQKLSAGKLTPRRSPAVGGNGDYSLLQNRLGD